MEQKYENTVVDERINTWLRLTTNNYSNPVVDNSLVLDLSNLNLTSLPILPDNVKALNCSNNKITSITNLPKQLIKLNCSNNLLLTLLLKNSSSTNTSINNSNPSSMNNTSMNNSSINNSNPILLEELYCGHNYLQELDLPRSLTKLYCENNELQTLNLPPNLTDCIAGDNKLTKILNFPDSLTNLDITNNQIEYLWTTNPLVVASQDSYPPINLKYLYCSKNLISNLILPANLQKLDCSVNRILNIPLFPHKLESIECNHNRLKKLAELPPNLKTLDCANNQLTELPDLPDSVEYLDCADNQITRLPDLPKDLETILVSGNNIMFTTEQIIKLSTRHSSDSHALIKIDIDITELIIEARINEWTKGELLDLSGLELSVLPDLPSDIHKLNLNNNKFTELDLSEYKQLTYLYCDDNRLTSLTLNTEIMVLSACRNQLTNYGLDNILECKNLEFVDLIGNKLTEMILNPDILKINLSDNLLTEVKIVSASLDSHPFDSHLLGFVSIILDNNKITDIEIVGLTSLESLRANDNKIERITLENLNLLKTLKLSYNLINNIKIPVNVIHVELNNNMLTELPQLNNIKYLNCSENRIEKVIIENQLGEFPSSGNILLTLELSDNDIRVVSGIDKLTALHSLELNNNFLTEFPNISYDLKSLDLDNNNITVFPNLKPYKLHDISINNNLIRHISGDMLPDTLTTLNYLDNIIDKCPDLDPRIEVECNLYDNYIDMKNDDYEQQLNTFLDVAITNEEHQKELDERSETEWKRDERSETEWKRDEWSETESGYNKPQSKSKRTRTNNVQCANITTILGDDVNNGNTDILILNPVNDKYIIYCYNYTEYFDALKSNKIYEWDVASNSGNPNIIYYKEPYIGIFIDRKGYELSKIYNTFIVQKVGIKKVGTISDNWVSRIHGQEYDIYTLIPIKQRDLVASITEKRKLRDDEMMLRDVELADLNIHFRPNSSHTGIGSGIQTGIGIKYVDYTSENLNIHVYWSKSMRSEEINYFINKKTKIKYTTSFVNRRLF